ncbi:MAG TPA: hypothetical protein VMQ44_00375 [Candidatus Saccharimonadales bacterium]|nr:hypothetical protein [Candidatus Saccharimonadales bacterium]
MDKNSNVSGYIESQRALGKSDEEIKASLVSSGWDNESIKEYFQESVATPANNTWVSISILAGSVLIIAGFAMTYITLQATDNIPGYFQIVIMLGILVLNIGLIIRAIKLKKSYGSIILMFFIEIIASRFAYVAITSSTVNSGCDFMTLWCG